MADRAFIWAQASLRHRETPRRYKPVGPVGERGSCFMIWQGNDAQGRDLFEDEHCHDCGYHVCGCEQLHTARNVQPHPYNRLVKLCEGQTFTLEAPKLNRDNPQTELGLLMEAQRVIHAERQSALDAHREQVAKHILQQMKDVFTLEPTDPKGAAVAKTATAIVKHAMPRTLAGRMQILGALFGTPPDDDDE